jgi:hypothetical protein
MEIMKFTPKNPPREFEVGFDKKGIIRDCGVLVLAADEQVTLTTEQGGEYDVTRKSWGFYATPSTNGRLSGFGLRAVLVKNRLNRHFVLLVENGHQHAFKKYCEQEPLTIVAWLDNSEDLEKIGRAVSPGH